MNLLDILIILLFIIIVLAGLKEGAVKHLSSLVSLIIAIPLTGLSYRLMATILSFLPGTNWENFFGFFITLGIITVIFHLIFLLPRKIVQKIWKKGILYRLLGGIFNFFETCIGLTVFSLVLMAFPIFDWLERWVTGSGILMWLVDKFGFVAAMLPDLFHNAGTLV